MACPPLVERYADVEAQVEKACVSAGRRRDEVRLIAVSKFHPAQAILEVARAGQLEFGENYVQEAEAKRAELAELLPNLRWHLIGHLQSRKAAQVAGRYTLIHTLDTCKLADALEKRLEGNVQDVLIEVNIGSEGQKSGVEPDGLAALATHIAEKCPHLNLLGLMCMPPVYDSGDAARPFFARLRHLRDGLEKGLGKKLPELSMGMSGDFPGAIAEGATIIRVGTGIFGPRPARPADINLAHDVH